MRSRTNLDALRAFAVLSVLLAHTTSLAGFPVVRGWDLRWLGVFGVYLFFVHTCLVLMWSLERRPDTFDFYLRRIFRIYPLAVVTVLLILAFHLKAFYAPAPLSKGLVLSNLLLIQNLWTHPDILGVLWSLPLEVDMYVLLPVFAAFARRESTLWSMLLIWSMACLLNIATYRGQMGNSWYMVIPHFLPGVMAYIGFRIREARLPAWGLALGIAAVTVAFMHRPSVEAGWVACLVVGLLLPLFRDTTSHAIGLVTHRVATYSYGIYLLHFLCLWACFKVFAGHSLWLILGTGLSMTALSATAAYHLIEEPMIRLGNRVAQAITHRRSPKLGTRDLNLEVAP